MAEGAHDDDYMGDISLFLPPELPSSSKKPSFSKPLNEPPFGPKPKRPKTLSWQEHRKFEQNRKQREEDEQTKSRLDAAIPESNLGFRMLQQMGYKPGTSLGKTGFGIVKPVGLAIRRSRAGIGRETLEEAELRKEREAKEVVRVREENMMAEFGVRVRTQWREKRVVGDYRKAEAVLAQLENREGLEDEKDGEEGEKERDGEGEEEVVITEEVYVYV